MSLLLSAAGSYLCLDAATDGREAGFAIVLLSLAVDGIYDGIDG
jgi:hypothetical protein